MNKEQLEALTEDERDAWRRFEESQHYHQQGIPVPYSVLSNAEAGAVLTALADARLEAAELRPLAVSQMFPCSRCGQEWLWPGVLSVGMAVCPPCLRAEVARLTEERNNWHAGKQDSDDVIRRIVGLVPRDASKEDILTAIKRTVRERDHQREDIRRLVECGQALADHVHAEFDANCVEADRMLRVLFDLKEKYDA